MQQVYKSLAWVLLSDSLADSTWYTAAEAAVTAIYALHQAPQELAQVIVQRLGKVALQNGSSSSSQDDTGVSYPLSAHELSSSWVHGCWVLASVCLHSAVNLGWVKLRASLCLPLKCHQVGLE